LSFGASPSSTTVPPHKKSGSSGMSAGAKAGVAIVRAVLSCPVLSCPVLSCPVLSCPVLCCAVLCCVVLCCAAAGRPADGCLLTSLVVCCRRL
jgi:hypothetical protein